MTAPAPLPPTPAPIPGARPVTVRGGSTAAIDVAVTDIDTAARRFDEISDACGAAAAAVRAVLGDPELELSRVLDRAGFAVFEDALLAAVQLPTGLGAAAFEAGAIAAELRRAARSYIAVDADVDGWVGATGIVGGGGSGAPDWLTGIVRLPLATETGMTVLLGTHHVGAAGQAFAATDPQLADTVMTLGGTRLDQLVAPVVPDGHPIVHDTGVDRGPVAARAPRRLTDVIDDLGLRCDDPRSGEIDVRILAMADGSRRAIVDVSGTRSWNPGPSRDITSLTTNERALIGLRTAYEQGVLVAMRRAGVRRSDDVMIVGHSQGGMVAVNAARDADRSGRFRVTHVITAGSPIAQTVGALPRRVRVLALENRSDVVPHLDGSGNPVQRNVTTVTGERGDGSVIGDHGVDSSYLPIAADTQASGSAQVDDYLSKAGGYLHAVRVTTHTYRIERGYG